VHHASAHSTRAGTANTSTLKLSGAATRPAVAAVALHLQRPPNTCCTCLCAASKLRCSSSLRLPLASGPIPLLDACVLLLPCQLHVVDTPLISATQAAQKGRCLASAFPPSGNVAKPSFIKELHFLAAPSAKSPRRHPPESAGLCRCYLSAPSACTALIKPPQPGSRAFAAAIVVY